MATKDVKDNARDLLECSICIEPFKRPKGLPCIHTFCLECLEKYGEEEGPGDELECPTCRQMFKIPPGGFKNLPNNIFIEQMAASTRLFRGGLPSKPTGVLCDGCKKRDAQNYCVECTEPMCEACSVTHGNQRATRTHKIVSLSEKEGSQVYMRARPTYCETHKDEQPKLYCYVCNKAICVLCSALEHKTHLCAHLQSASIKFGDELKSSYPKLDKSMDALKSERKSLKKNKTSFLKQIEVCESAIVKRGVELKRLVDKRCSKLVDELQKVRDEQIKKMQVRKDEVDRQLLMLSSFKTYVEELTTKGSACAISQSAKDLLARGNELHTAQAEFRKGCLVRNRVTFELASIPEILGGSAEERLIGSIEINGNIVSATERVFTVVGLCDGDEIFHRVCHISLERAECVRTIDSTPAVVSQVSAACVMGDTLYVVGIGDERGELWKWTAAFDWTRCADMLSDRFCHSVASIDSMLYALGGCADTGNTVLSSVEAYHAPTNKWSAAGRLTHAVGLTACVSYNNSIYLFGGGDTNKADVAHVQVYDAAQRKCTLLHNAMPRAYHGMRAVVWETSAILLHHETCFIYNFETQTWLERPSYKTHVDYFGLVIDKETLYIAGGRTSNMDVDIKLTSTDAVRCVSVRNVMEDKRGERWKRHATLPQPSIIFAYSPAPLSLKLLNLP